MAVSLLPGPPTPPTPVICRNASPAPPGPPERMTFGGIVGTCGGNPRPPANQLSIPVWNVSIWPITTAPAIWGNSATPASSARDLSSFMFSPEPGRDFLAVDQDGL